MQVRFPAFSNERLAAFAVVNIRGYQQFKAHFISAL
jgi:hypothetical protein